MGSSATALYTAAAVPGATSYNWTVPAGATVVSGAGTISIAVSYSTSFVSGNVAVQAVTNCGSSTFKTLAITKAIPLAPASVTGPVNACAYMGSSGTATYVAAAVTGASSYYWTVPSGATIVSGQGTNTINVSYNTSFVSGNVAVQSVAGCGSSAFKTLAITKTLPLAPGTVSGPANVCAYIDSSPVTYSITPVATAVSYNWTVPSGAVIVSGAGTSSISVSYSSPFTPGNISVQSVSGCGNSAFKTLAITGTISAPAAITGPSSVCEYAGSASNATYTAATVTDATSYTWTVPANASIVSGQGTATIDVSYASSFVSGNVSVQSVSNCGTSVVKSLAITKKPATPGVISGPANICGILNATYSVSAVTGADTYNWTLPAGISPDASTTGTISTSGTTGITTVNGSTNSILVNIDTAVVTTALAIIKVSAANSCGTSVLRTLSLTACRSAESTGIQAADEAGLFTLYPNPSTDKLIVEIAVESDQEVLLEVFDVAGQKVIAEKHSLLVGVNSLTTTVSGLQAGTYLIKVRDNSSSLERSAVFIKR